MRPPHGVLCFLAIFLPALLGCGGPPPAASVAGGPSPAPLFDNLGDLHHAVTTNSEQAQRYFDQGLRLVYAFNHDEAVRSFREAARLDPSCAMAYWGVALALGPNINLPTDPDREHLAGEMVARARALEAKVSPAERDYIEALARRYPERAGADRARAAADYADAMREVSRAHPDDPDAATLFAESLMDLRPWRLWTSDGRPAPDTEEIVTTLEAVLRAHPDHLGANHYYIHTMEGSPHPERALEAADRLPSLAPGAGHVVHMPCHIYIHTGRWADASTASERGIEADRAYLAKAKPEGVYPMMYVAHNFQFLAFTAAMEGRSTVALQAAEEMVRRMPAGMVKEMEASLPGVDYFLAPPIFTMVRFGRWRALLDMPQPPAEFRYLTALWRFGRGLALARTGKPDEADRERQALVAFVSSLKDDEMVGPLNRASAVFGVASALLEGEIALARGRTDEAIRRLRAAVAAEDRLSYDEPPAWWQSARLSLGAALLEAGRAREAARVYEADLGRFPENGWALYGLAQALKLERSPAAADAEARFQKAWARADVTLAATRF